MNKEFLHCLRITIVPGHHEQQRIESVVAFCKKHNFKNAMLFINAEEYNQGHMTIEEARPWVETMKRAKAALNAEGISVSVNPWIEIGHLERGRSLKPGQNFTTMVDYDGYESTLVACPMDDAWWEYFKEYYTYLLKEIEPEVIWVEDDFRLHNHAPLKYGGCFCKHHMAAYNAKLGTNYTREEFTDLLFRKDANEDVKRAFLEVSRECMASLAKKIGDAVKAASPKTQVGLMSSAHIRHEMEGRDWKAVHEGFAAGGEMINRLHMPMYMETGLKGYYTLFNAFTFVCRGQIPDEVKVYPEMENHSFNTFAKDSECVRFQVESALPLELSGMTYNIFDFAGNGAIEQYGYGETMHKIHPYLNGVLNCGYRFRDLQGVVFPVDEKMAYYKKIKVGNFMSLSPEIPYFWARLQAYGIACCTTREKEMSGKTVALYSDIVASFTDEQLVKLFANNSVICDGSAVMVLVDRGLGHLIGVKGYSLEYASEESGRSYEQVAGDKLIYGIPGFRATALNGSGGYAKIEYEADVDVKSYIYNFHDEMIGFGDVQYGKHFIRPFFGESICEHQFSPLRQMLMQDFVRQVSPGTIMTEYEALYAYQSQQGNEAQVIFVNTTVNPFNELVFTLGVPVREIREVCRDGVTRVVPFLQDGNRVVVQSPVGYLSTKTLLLTL